MSEHWHNDIVYKRINAVISHLSSIAYKKANPKPPTGNRRAKPYLIPDDAEMLNEALRSGDEEEIKGAYAWCLTYYESICMEVKQ